MKNYIKILSISIITLVTVSCGNNKAEKLSDSSDSTSVEATKSKTPSYNSPDLAFFDLYDNVKSCEFVANENEWDEPQSYSFNENGMWSNMPTASWSEYELQYIPELKNKQPYERNEEGYICISNNCSDMEGLIQKHYEWEHGRVVAIKTDSEVGNISFEYDENGLLKTKQQEAHGLEGYEFLLSTYTYSDYEFDEHHNWVKRNVSRTQYEIDDAGRKNFVGEHYFTEKRTISYF